MITRYKGEMICCLCGNTTTSRWYYNEHMNHEKGVICNSCYKKRYRENNHEYVSEYDNEYKKRPERLVYRRKHVKQRMKTDISFKIRNLIRGKIHKYLKRGKYYNSSLELLGCSIPYFRKYIESKFYGDMTWDNWGTYWQLDHIKPVHTFDVTDKIELLKAFNFVNTQPLTIKDHKIKTNNELKEEAKLRKRNLDGTFKALPENKLI